MSRQPLRWGILGTGKIAEKFAAQLVQAPSAKLAAVGSRSPDQARAFAARHGCPEHGSYEAVLSQVGVDAVYLSLPNLLHHRWTLEALQAGKHVLCEKPLAVNVEQAEEMFAVARRSERMLVEAFMYRCHGAVREVIATVRPGGIGEVRVIRTNFTFNRAASRDDVRYRPELAGGSLMDVGCYCINFARAITAQEPAGMHAVAHLHELGVDDYAAGVLGFPSGAVCSFTCGMTVENDRTTFIGGSEGRIAIEDPWFCNGEFTVIRGDERDTITVPEALPPYALEAEMFARVVRGEEGPWITPEDSLGNIRVLEMLRRQVGLPY
ncbi:MAG: Gfo/Idh/MocA family oxidoreductase [Planctomycetes bacterium]|nr:Gfo/Idh/MocA family oxidoreductase [Planctomycetota bacterium]